MNRKHVFLLCSGEGREGAQNIIDIFQGHGIDQHD